jgi:hypothetical protein
MAAALLAPFLASAERLPYPLDQAVPAVSATNPVSARPDGLRRERSAAVVRIEGTTDAGSIIAGEVLPDLQRRPPALRPGVLPPRIRYKFSPDIDMAAAARLAAEHLLESRRDTSPLFDEAVWLQPGAWKWLKPTPGLAARASGMNAAVRTRSGVLHLEGKIISNPQDQRLLEDTLRHLIRADGGGRLRAMTTQEMKRWWPFIAFDIQEPTLVLETARGSHRFVLTFENGRLVAVDDLTGLPRLS